MTGPAHHAGKIDSVTFAIVTVSDTRTAETDVSGGLARQSAETAGHRVASYEIIPDEPDRVRRRVQVLCDEEACQAVLLTGGTGLAPRDTTYEAVTSILDKRLEGFGELFRMLSYEEVGSNAMLSRAVAGTCRSTVIFSLPGSTAAVRLAMEKLILPQIGHLVWLVRRDSGR